ncbi:iron chelate uptake ABC transporter family permease subunit [Bacillus licheniformis]|nr:iron chelate uptake ABC transporter family permease subunit [Bacillus licheniformis]
MNMGEIRIDPLATLRTLFGFGTPQDELVLFEFRLPRMILAMLIGAGVAVSGAVWQGISRNDLADPGILGINTGAGLPLCCSSSISGRRWQPAKGFVFPCRYSHFGSLLCSRFHLFAGVEKGLNPIRLVWSASE